MWSKNWHFFPLLTLVSSFVESGEVFRGVVSGLGAFFQKKVQNRNSEFTGHLVMPRLP